MSITKKNDNYTLLKQIARKAMLEKGLLPGFSAAALSEITRIQESEAVPGPGCKDERQILWCSIDNDDSLDLDQLTVAEELPLETVKIKVAIADVDAVVKKDTALDVHARQNTASVYTAAEIFPMLPNKLSQGITSLNPARDRFAVVIEMTFDGGGNLLSSGIYRALVRNHAKLAYNSVAAWLEGTVSMPEGIKTINGLSENLRLQSKTAQKLKSLRQSLGALELNTIETHPIFEGKRVVKLEADKKNLAKDIIEDFMIAANGIVARFLAEKKYALLRRVVRIPKYWGRIVSLAAEKGYKLPKDPDPKALNGFLFFSKARDLEGFPDVSLSVIKLLGAGEYVVELLGMPSNGHFGLAVKDYAHSTAPNRRFPDLISIRLLKAAVAAIKSPYSNEEIQVLAKHCTLQEDAVKKVERQVGKSVAALLLEPRIGEEFDAIVTGASNKGTWVRLFNPPAEGRLVLGYEGLEVGNRIRVKLLNTNVERGYIDFSKEKA